MTNMPTVLSDYESSAADKATLGRISWFSVQSGAPVIYDQVVEELTAHGLKEHAPNKPGATDLFRRVTSSAQRKRIDAGDDRYHNILIRDVATDEDNVLRRMVCETVDAKGKRLDYREDFDVTFHKPSETIGIRKLTAFISPADDIAEQILRDFNSQRGTLSSDAIRGMLQRALRAMKCISVRETGGVLFCLRTHVDELSRLEQVAATIPGCDMHSLPLIDEHDGRQADMVKQAVTDEAVKEIDKALNDMRTILADGGEITPAKFAAFNTQYRHLTGQADEYAELLQTSLDGVSGRLTIFGSVMAQLASQIKAAA